MVSRWEVAIPYHAKHVDVNNKDEMMFAYFQCTSPVEVMQWVSNDEDLIEEFVRDNWNEFQRFVANVKQHQKIELLRGV